MVENNAEKDIESNKNTENKANILRYIADAVRPLTEEEIAQGLGFDTVEKLVEMKSAILALEEKGDLVLTRKGKLGTPEQLGLLVGKITRHARGFGFLVVDDADMEDIFIAPDDLASAQHNDKVIVRLKRQAMDDKNGKHYRAEGEVIRILERASTKVVGTFEKHKGYGYVIPDDPRFGGDIFIPPDGLNGAKNKMKVLAEITQFAQNKRNAEGIITEIIGAADEVGVDTLSIIYRYDLPREFPPEVLAEVEKLPDKVDSSQLTGRRDLRDKVLVTIDGADAKDLDDAVSLEVLADGKWRLGVHIADVSAYVAEDSALDLEARRRATSVYLVDRVLPMLPPKLSNGICSLNPHEDRLALSIVMDIDYNGVVQNQEIFPSVINTRHRLTYDEVNLMYNDADNMREKYADIWDMIEQMGFLQEILFHKRLYRGALDFEFPESKVILDEQGKPIEIKSIVRGKAERVIEEFMLCANETIAENYYWLEIPFLYRVHAAPNADSVNDVKQFLQIFGYSLKGSSEQIHAKDYQKILHRIKHKPEERAIASVMLRSMNHARYEATKDGHFGLACEYYTHFTSPIRRYPDLAIHRMIKEMMTNNGVLAENRRIDLQNRMENYALHSSMREKVAEEAERDSIDMKMAEYMLPFIGETFNGTISGVTSFGFFVELENSVEGLVHISTLVDDFYHFRQESYSLLGEHTKQVFKLGQQVQVKLVRVNLLERQIDFEYVSEVL